MSRWTTESALSELRLLAGMTESLAKQRRDSAEHIRWITRVRAVLEEVFGQESVFYNTFVNFSWKASWGFFGGRDPAAAIERKDQETYQQQLDSARGLLLGAIDQLERTDLESVYRGKDTGPETSAIMKVINLAGPKLRKAFHTVPQKERDVQDAFETLLVGADVDYSREKDTIEYSSKNYIPDFTMAKIDLAVDIKLCKKEREKEIISEINDDIMAYKTKYGNVLFVVYDLGIIRDEERFIASFEDHPDVIVRVVKQ